MKIIINEAMAGKRLDVLLSEILEQTRSQIQKMIKSELVMVNKQTAKANYQTRLDDKIEISKPATKKELAVSAPLPEIKIIKETADYLVINKPAGLLVHGARGKNELTLVDWLIQHEPKIKKVGDDESRPGIVHRLDRDVNGLMVIAKTQAMWLALKKQFQERSIIKEYQALAYDDLKSDRGVINFLLARATQGGKMAARPLSQTGKEAVTEYEVVKHFINYTYLKLIIKTGRTHQIRAHMAALGHPLVGDDLYGTKLTREKNKKLALGRIWLMSSRLSFVDLAGEKQEFKLALPSKLKEVLKNVK